MELSFKDRRFLKIVNVIVNSYFTQMKINSRALCIVSVDFISNQFETVHAR